MADYHKEEGLHILAAISAKVQGINRDSTIKKKDEEIKKIFQYYEKLVANLGYEPIKKIFQLYNFFYSYSFKYLFKSI